MPGKISILAAKYAETDIGSDQLCSRLCFISLSSKGPEKRDCAIAMLTANGFDPERIANLYSSSKTKR